MCFLFTANSANNVWLQAFNTIKEHHNTQESRAGTTIEILHAHLNITKPRQRWITVRSPVINPAFAIAEVFWILSGRNDTALINYWNPSLPKYAGINSTYHGAYGYRLIKQFGFDQLDRAYKVLCNNPTSRQVVLQIWDPCSDFPDEHGERVSEDIPCNICSMLKIRNKKLEWLQIMRSNDLFLGTPYNIIQFTTIQEILAGWLGIELGSFHLVCDSLHIYEKDLTNIVIIEHDEIDNNESLAVSKREFESILQEIIDNLIILASPQLTKKIFNDIIMSTNIIHPYRNLLLIAACDTARRHHWIEELYAAKHNCNNALLLQSWNLWESRNSGGDIKC